MEDDTTTEAPGVPQDASETTPPPSDGGGDAAQRKATGVGIYDVAALQAEFLNAHRAAIDSILPIGLAVSMPEDKLLSAVLKERDMAKARAEKAEAERDELRAVFDDRRTLCSELDSSRCELAEWKAKVEKAEKELLDYIEAAGDASDREREGWKAKVAFAEAERDQARRERDDLRAARDVYQEALVGLEEGARKLREVEAERDEARRERDQARDARRLPEWGFIKADLEERLCLVTRERDELRARLEAGRAAILAAADSGRENAGKTADLLRKVEAERDDLRAQLATTKAVLDATNERGRTVEKATEVELARLDVERADLRARLATAAESLKTRDVVEELSRVQAIASMQARVIVAEDARAAAKAELATVTAERDRPATTPSPTNPPLPAGRIVEQHLDGASVNWTTGFINLRGDPGAIHLQSPAEVERLVAILAEARAQAWPEVA
ncbi:MAG: hypothetical protein WCS88_03995 [Patescibacteria group bacterium]|jgi:chromosome segregation ATPase